MSWDFFTNHAHILLCIARNPECRIRDLAEQVGITERAVQRIVSDLEDAGYLAHARDGRRNRYEIKPDLPLRHPIEQHRSVAALIATILGPEALRPSVPPPSRSSPKGGEARAASERPSPPERLAHDKGSPDK